MRFVSVSSSGSLTFNRVTRGRVGVAAFGGLLWGGGPSDVFQEPRKVRGCFGAGHGGFEGQLGHFHFFRGSDKFQFGKWLQSLRRGLRPFYGVQAGASTGVVFIVVTVGVSKPFIRGRAQGGGSRGTSAEPLGEGSNWVRSRKRSSADAAGGARLAVRAWVVMMTDKAEGTRESRGAVRAGGRWSREAREDNVTGGEKQRGGGVVNQEGGGRSEAGEQGVFQLGSFDFSSEAGSFSGASVRRGGEAGSRAHAAVLVIHTCNTCGCVVGAMRPGVW